MPCHMHDIVKQWSLVIIPTSHCNVDLVYNGVCIEQKVFPKTITPPITHLMLLLAESSDIILTEWLNKFSQLT